MLINTVLKPVQINLYGLWAVLITQRNPSIKIEAFRFIKQEPGDPKVQWTIPENDTYLPGDPRNVVRMFDSK